MKLFFTLIGSVFLFESLHAQAPDTTYIWPTNASPYLSSTFGETRSAHFHAGLDIKTWGQEGYEVYATREGILSRLIITNQGYGKAVYLRHPDSTYTVYAHLQRFAPEYQGIVDSVRLQDFNYETDVFLEGRELRIEKGSVIGYTGSTGVGPPHLHYEIRNRNNEPVNALLSNLEVDDTVPPVFSALMLEPQTPHTLVDRSPYPKVIRPKTVEQGVFDFGEVRVSGSIGISANIFDMSDHVTNRYAAYELLLVHDGDTLYRERIDRFNFDQADNMFLNRATIPFNNRRAFQRLFLKEGNNHPFVLSHRGSVAGNFDQPYIIIAKDINGNSSQALIRFLSDNTYYPSERVLLSMQNVEQVSEGFWTEDWVVLSDSSYLDLKAPGSFSQPTMSLQRILPEKQVIQRTADYRLTTRYAPHTFFDTLSVLQYYRIQDDEIHIHLAGSNLPARKNFGLQFYLGNLMEANTPLHLYQRDDEGEFSYMESWVSGATLFAYPDQPGDFVILSDSLPPVIDDPELITLPDNRQSIRIRVHDDLSGVDFRTALFMVNGIRGIPEYDYETDEFVFYHPDLKLQNRNRVYFEVKDQAGNQSHIDTGFDP